MRYSLFYLALYGFCLPLYAGSFGDMSNHLLGPTSGMGHLLNASAYLIGVGFFLGGLVQYKYHRENPQQVKISTPIALVIIGAAMIALPFIARLSSASSFLK